jgi:hypothetical protein
MDILDAAIERAGGVGNLAVTLGVRQSAVSNWRARGLPRPWRMVLEARYQQNSAQTPANSAQAATETVATGGV